MAARLAEHIANVRAVMSGRQAVDDARMLWRLADQARTEANEHRQIAAQLEREAERLNKIAADIQDGRTIAEALAK